ncbi:helix-turn-helix transcriptional regulator [Streptomyces sp. NPDC050617]|uniref:helix-turn-helix transcriptional regulator n=1 Tax=Streptomyces sp. NPDC050617 TaxID=3154628 RepID=UPI003449F7FB
MTARLEGTHRLRYTIAAEAQHAVDVPELGHQLSQQVKLFLPHDGYMLAGLDPLGDATCFFTAEGGYSIGFNNRLEEADSLGDEPHPFAQLLRGPARVGVLNTSSTAHRDSLRLRGMVAEDFGSEMRIALAASGYALGALVLLRRRDTKPFSSADTARAEGLSAPLAEAVRRFMARQALRPSRLTLPTGVVVIGPDDTIRSVTPTVWDWLRLLSAVAPVAVGKLERTENLRYVTRNISLLARRARRPVTSRIATRDGWVSVQGQPLGGEESGTVVVTYQQATAATLLPSLSAWCGITSREQTVLGLLLQGMPTKRLARKLDLSPHTVNDHLKAIYRKVGASGRDELVASF